MFYFPGSWHIGSVIQWLLNLFLAVEFWPFYLMEPMDWDDNERRGAGSLFILMVLIAAMVLGGLIVAGVV